MRVNRGNQAEAVLLLTVNFSRVNCGARIEFLDVWWVSTDEPSELMRCMVAEVWATAPWVLGITRVYYHGRLS